VIACYTGDMNVTLEKISPESEHINTFYFRPEKPLHYTAGQFIELTVPHENPDERGTKHWFTLSSSPTDELLSITTRFSRPSSTFKQALMALEPGAVLHMSDAMGDFVLPKLIQTPLIFVAGGIGITPFHSMLSWLADTGEKRPIKLLYAVSREDDILFQDTFDKAGVHATIVVSEPSDAWGGERGRLHAEMILGLEKPSEDTLIYLSGPEPMVEQLAKDLKSQGINKQQLVLDMFPNYTINY
jgi:glycine betaine catabolism B